MIDISDGLSSDLGHILDESGRLGAVLDAASIPIHPDARALSHRDGVAALDHALNDGEDFELCLVVAPEDAERLIAAPPAPAALYQVGVVTEPPRNATPLSRRSLLSDRTPRIRSLRGHRLIAFCWPGAPLGVRSTIPMRVTKTTEGLTIELETEDDTVRLGRAIADLVEPGHVIGLAGPLGAGKTRLARAIAEATGVDPSAISSPTFVLIHEYAGRLPVFHFDAYRLESPQAFEDLGLADYWSAGGLCLVEWADRVRSLLPAEHWMITLDPTGPSSRSVRVAWSTVSTGVIDGLVDRLACD